MKHAGSTIGRNTWKQQEAEYGRLVIVESGCSGCDSVLSQ